MDSSGKTVRSTPESRSPSGIIIMSFKGEFGQHFSQIQARDEISTQLRNCLHSANTMKYRLGGIILASAIGALAIPTQNVLSVSKPRPLVIWHGLGASALFPDILVRAFMGSPSPR